MKTLKIIVGVLISIPVLVCLITGAVVLGTAAGAIYAISRPQESRVVLTIPMTDDRGRSQSVVITMTGKPDADQQLSQAAQQTAASGELAGNLAVYIGPFGWKLVETQVRIRVPLEEMLRDAMQAALKEATSGAMPTLPPGILPPATPTPRR